VTNDIRGPGAHLNSKRKRPDSIVNPGLPFPKIEFLRAQKQVWKIFAESARERSVCAPGIPVNPAKSVKVTVSSPRQNRPNFFGRFYVETLISLVDFGTERGQISREVGALNVSLPH
jgi:hypothetical protein